MHQVDSPNVAQITTDGTNNMYPSIVWNGSEFGLTWQDDREGNTNIYFTRVNASLNAKLISDKRIDISPSNACRPSIASFEDKYGIAWEDSRHGEAEIYFTIVNADGNKITNEIRISTANGISGGASLVFNGREFCVAWHDGRNGQWDICVARISTNGTGLSESRVTTDNNFQKRPSLVWNGSEYVLAWQDNRNGVYEIYIAYLNASGNKIEQERKISSSISNTLYPSLIWAGSGPAAVWCDYQDADGEIYLGY